MAWVADATKKTASREGLMLGSLFHIIAETVTNEPDSIPSYEKIGVITILLLIGYLFMSKKIVVGSFYVDALTRNKEIDEENKAVRKTNHELRNSLNAAMLEIADLTQQLAAAAHQAHPSITTTTTAETDIHAKDSP